MKKAIIGKKVGMTQIFSADGKIIPVTVIEAGPCYVVQKKTCENDGYSAVQLGYGEIEERKLTKPEKGHLAKAGVSTLKYLKEFRLEDAESMNVGDELKADVFAEGDKVDVTGTSKGKGYAGVIKRCSRPYVSRRRPRPSSRRFHERKQLSFPHFQGQDRRRSSGR